MPLASSHSAASSPMKKRPSLPKLNGKASFSKLSQLTLSSSSPSVSMRESLSRSSTTPRPRPLSALSLVWDGSQTLAHSPTLMRDAPLPASTAISQDPLSPSLLAPPRRAFEIEREDPVQSSRSGEPGSRSHSHSHSPPQSRSPSRGPSRSRAHSRSNSLSFYDLVMPRHGGNTRNGDRRKSLENSYEYDESSYPPLVVPDIPYDENDKKGNRDSWGWGPILEARDRNFETAEILRGAGLVI